jgi:hypothetical protein
MDVISLTENDMRKLLKHGHKTFWELRIDKSGAIFMDCTKCGKDLVQLVKADNVKTSD